MRHTALKCSGFWKLKLRISFQQLLIIEIQLECLKCNKLNSKTNHIHLFYWRSTNCFAGFLKDLFWLNIPDIFMQFQRTDQSGSNFYFTVQQIKSSQFKFVPKGKTKTWIDNLSDWINMLSKCLRKISVRQLKNFSNKLATSVSIDLTQFSANEAFIDTLSLRHISSHFMLKYCRLIVLETLMDCESIPKITFSHEAQYNPVDPKLIHLA